MKVIFFANTDWYLFNFRLPLARELRRRGAEVLFLSPTGEHGQRLVAEGFRWEALPMDRRSLDPVRELQLVRHLTWLYRREQPDLVHHFTIKCVVYGAIAAARARVPARVNAVAGLGYVFTNAGAKARLLRPVVRGLLRAALNRNRSRLILQNGDDVDAFQRARLVDPEHVRLIHGSGVDSQHFGPAPLPPLTDSPVRVLLAARMLWDKGVGDFVEAARVLRSTGLPIRFLLAGAPDPGNPASIPQEQLEAWQREGLVELLGHIENMSEQLRNVDIAVLPSYREGLPKGLIEAAACALPLVTTDVPGCRDVVTDGINGLIVPPRDPAALAAAIRRLHDDPALARRLGRAARDRVLAEFDQDIVHARTIDVYRELLGSDALRAPDEGYEAPLLRAQSALRRRGGLDEIVGTDPGADAAAE